MKPIPRKLILLIAAPAALVTLGTVALYWQPLLAWYEFQREFETLPVNAQGLPEYKHLQTGIIFVKVPGGTFMMGSPENEVGRLMYEDLQPEKTLSPFLIGKYEVTQEQWEIVMGSNPAHFKGRTLPVENISWNDIQEFEKKAGLTLPTEIQWEYACRAGTQTPFNFGEKISSNQVNCRGDFRYNDGFNWKFRNKTVEVQSFSPNKFGLFNMHGNVFEWCEGRFSEIVVTDPNPYFNNRDRVMRGGSWSSVAQYVRSATRVPISPHRRLNYIGFRPVRNLEWGD